MTDLNDRMESLADRTSRIQAKHENAVIREAQLAAQVETLEHDLQVLGKVSELFKHLIERYVLEYAESFSELVTEGLQAIYYDQDVSFDIEITQKRGKVHAEFVTEQNGRRGKPLDSFGGGVASVESLLLRILVVLRAEMARYLFLDESLAALSAEYVDTCGEFLRKLCDRLNVNILLVTHNEGFLEHANRAYRGSADSNERLKLTLVREVEDEGS
jgi:hypothetical protein